MADSTDHDPGAPPAPPRQFPFRFDALYQAVARPFGVRPDSTLAEVDGERLVVRFGPWRVDVERSNIVGACLTGPYGLVRTMGPARLSLKDRGLTFATNRDRGLCIRFAAPVRGIEPTGLLRHPGLTVTVADPAGLAAALGYPLAGG